MQFKILKISSKNFKKAIKETIHLIRRGGVLVCPTDTVYGLVADATNKKAVLKIFKIKKRKTQKFLPLFVNDLKTAKDLAEINKEQERFLKKFWPGRMTAVLKRKKAKLRLYGLDKKTIALRIPNYKLINGLIQKLNRPLTGTSANISGRATSAKFKKVIAQFKNKKYQPDLILDAGNLKPSKPSMVIDFTGRRPKIIRKGSGKIKFNKIPYFSRS